MKRFGFAFENTIGHVTFAQTLHDAIAMHADLEAVWLPLGYEPRGAVERLPWVRDNWSLRASLRARALLTRRTASRPLDALLFHTQTAALLSVGVMRSTPTVISVDATPRNIDEVAVGYAHHVGGAAVERIKRDVVRRPLAAASGVVAWSEWVRRSLTADYAVSPSSVTVIPAGTNLPPRVPDRDARPWGPPRVLFVGGAFERKGGHVLLEALQGVSRPFELHVVSTAAVVLPPGATLHHGVRPGDERLARLYAAADLFVLPTIGDTFGHVVLEAMAAGLPVVATSVGAIPELVEDGVTGRLVAPGDPVALRRVLEELLAAPERARAMGRAGRERAERDFDARRNADRILELMRRAADR